MAFKITPVLVLLALATGPLSAGAEPLTEDLVAAAAAADACEAGADGSCEALELRQLRAKQQTVAEHSFEEASAELGESGEEQDAREAASEEGDDAWRRHAMEDQCLA